MRWFTDAGQDARYAIRSLRKSPGFASVAVLTLALGIGATTAIYSVVDTILLQPLPFADGDRLVRVVENVPSPVSGRPAVQRGVSYQEFLEWRSRSMTLSDAVAISGWRNGPRAPATARRGCGARWFRPGVPAVRRAHRPRPRPGPGDEAQPDVIVITYDTWRHLFQSDPHVVGTKVELGAPQTAPRVLTLIGVLAADVELPTGTFDFYRGLRSIRRGRRRR
jgi:hypothetical protein